MPFYPVRMPNLVNYEEEALLRDRKLWELQLQEWLNRRKSQGQEQVGGTRQISATSQPSGSFGPTGLSSPPGGRSATYDEIMALTGGIRAGGQPRLTTTDTGRVTMERMPAETESTRLPSSGAGGGRTGGAGRTVVPTSDDLKQQTWQKQQEYKAAKDAEKAKRAEEKAAKEAEKQTKNVIDYGKALIGRTLTVTRTGKQFTLDTPQEFISWLEEGKSKLAPEQRTAIYAMEFPAGGREEGAFTKTEQPKETQFTLDNKRYRTNPQTEQVEVIAEGEAKPPALTTPPEGYEESGLTPTGQPRGFVKIKEKVRTYTEEFRNDMKNAINAADKGAPIDQIMNMLKKAYPDKLSELAELEDYLTTRE